MAAFQFQALDDGGKSRKGVLEADSPRHARQLLRERGWVALDVSPAAEQARGQKGSSLLAAFSQQGKLNGTELALITRQLATLVRSGMPIEQCLAAVAKQAGRARVEQLVMAVRAKVMEGHSLAASLGQFPKAFPEVYRATIAAGERSGHLEQVLEQLADYLETRNDTGRNVAQAMAYPAFIMVFSTLVIVVLMWFVVPKMVNVFTSQGRELPLLTSVMIAISGFVRSWLWLVVLVLVAGGLVFSRALKQPAFRLRVHRKLLHVPFIGLVIRAADSARLASTLGISGRSGVPLVEGLAIASQVVSNLAIREAVEKAARQVREGGSLNRALDKSGYFPPLMVQMIASGEASGELNSMLTRAADYQERNLNSTVSTVVGLLGPVMLLVMAGFVILVVLSVVLPMLEMNNFLGR